MRAEAQAVDVIPLRVPGEEAPMPPPEPAPPQEDGLLLPVPGSDRD